MMNGNSRLAIHISRIAKASFELGRLFAVEDTLYSHKKTGTLPQLDSVNMVSRKVDWLAELHYKFKMLGCPN